MAANIKYRETSNGTVPVATTVKGSPLTNAEMDANIKSIVDEVNTKASNTALTTALQVASENAIALSIALG